MDILNMTFSYTVNWTTFRKALDGFLDTGCQLLFPLSNKVKS